MTAFVVVVVACMAVAAVAIASAVSSGAPDPTAADRARTLLQDAAAGGDAMLVTRALGEGRGEVALARLGTEPGPRTLSSLRCDRVYFAAGAGLCVARGSGFAEGYRAQVFGPDLKVRHDLALEGVPSRARVSPDGRYGSVTMFVTGHSYADSGQFSTQTTLIDMATGKSIADLEEFAVMRGQRRVTAVDINFWGVTFARDSDRFYATLATGGKTYLIEGSVSGRSARVLRENVECPSLSPDGTRIAFKKRTDSRSVPWRLSVLDLETLRDTPLAETRSVDDQAEWLDDDHVLYGIDDSVSVVRADGGGEPRRFMSAAESPAVVRP